MGLKRNVGGARDAVPLLTALGYRGGAPMWTFILHRLGGIALFVFFSAYFLVLAGVRQANPFFYNPVFQIVVLVLGIFHAVNGLRISILDVWPKLLEYSPQAIRIEIFALAVIYAYVLLVILGG